MRKFFFTIFLLFSGLFTACAQPSTFMKTYVNGDNGYAVREMNANAYVVAGCTDFYYNFHWNSMSAIANTNIHLYKTTDDGTLLWEKIFQLPLARSLATWMETTQDGGIIITGRSNKDIAWPPDSNDVILVKCDADGLILWSKSYDTGKDELGFCVHPTLDGGYAISAFHDAAPMSLTGTTYAMLIKTDSTGNLMWSKSYEQAVRDLDTGEGLTWVFSQTTDSGYVMTGTTVGAHQADIYVIRTNKTGDLLWAKSYEHDNSVNRFSLGLDIIENGNKEIIIAASMDKDHSLNEYNYPCILKLDSAGNLIRAAIYNSIPPQSFQSGFSSVEQNSDGGYLFTGMGGYGGFGQQAQILKTDVDLNMLWSRSYTNDGNATMGSRSGRSTSDGSYIFTGKKFNAGSVLLKTDFIGLVPCKTPANLIELIPTILTVDRYPTSISGIVSTNLVFNSIPVGVDTTTECPVSISHLPIELTSFTASLVENKNVLLLWETSSEMNNDYFIIQKSLDGINFENVSVVNGSGNSTQVIRYSFMDKTPDLEDIIYYRLKQLDYDGAEHISKTITVQIVFDTFRLLKVQADRVGNQIIFNLISSGQDPISIKLNDVQGKLHINYSHVVGEGFSQLTVDANRFSKGIYFFQISNGRDSIFGKIIYAN